MLEIENLKTNFNTYDGVVKALDGVNLKIEDGEIFGLVGETGSGKSVTCYSALKLLPKAGEVVDGTIKLNGEDITNASDERLREIRGGEIGIIFQDPLSALNPVMTVNEQIGEILVLHQNAELQKLALEKEIPTLKSEKWKASPGVEFTIMAFCISFISLFVMWGIVVKTYFPHALNSKHKRNISIHIRVRLIRPWSAIIGDRLENPNSIIINCSKIYVTSR